jgi:5-methylthioribose kinase
MTKFDKHFRMTEEDAIDYIVEKMDYFGKGADLVATEVGDGNINYVFIIKDKNSDKSIVLKHADVLLRSSGRELDVDRNRIEAEVLKLQFSYVPDLVPEVYMYDPTMGVVVMEDVSAYKNLRKELMARKTFPKLADDITTFMVNTLLPTTDLVMDSGKKKDLQSSYINKDLCLISEDLVFTEPYIDFKGRNIVIPENMDYVKEHVYGDVDLVREAGILKNAFMNNAQALLHGDLHSGSIFVNQDGTKVLDPEFAFYGPIGYDLGNVIGNLMFSWAHAGVIYRDKDFTLWTEETITNIVTLFEEKFKALYDQIVTDVMAKTPAYKTWYLESVLADAAGCAGTEIIRRVVGDSKVAEVSDIENTENRVTVERLLIGMGKTLIKERSRFTNKEAYANLLKDSRQW